MAKVRRKNRVGIGLHCLAKDFGGLKHMNFKNLIIFLLRTIASLNTRYFDDASPK
jgi:hypothetical protein